MLATGILLAGCAVEAPPPGGAPDTEAPTLISSVPDDSATAVSRAAAIEVLFSEPMNHRDTERALVVAPSVRWAGFDWQGPGLHMEPAESLRAETVYRVLVGRDARDRHGNRLDRAVSLAFTTGDELPAGRIVGKVVPFRASETVRVFAVPWTGSASDSLPAVVPDSASSIAAVDTAGCYSLDFLPEGEAFWILAFTDKDGSGAYDEEEGEPRGWHPVPVTARAVPESANVRLFDPTREALVRGRVAGGEGDPPALVVAVSADDSTRQWTERPQGADGSFLTTLPAGTYRLGVFRDRNRDGRWTLPPPPSPPDTTSALPDSGTAIADSATAPAPTSTGADSAAADSARDTRLTEPHGGLTVGTEGHAKASLAVEPEVVSWRSGVLELKTGAVSSLVRLSAPPPDSSQAPESPGEDAGP